MSHIEQNRRYFDYVQRAMKEILATSGRSITPVSSGRSPEKQPLRHIIVISGDKGLCGSYNHNVLNLAYEKIMAHRDKHSIVTIGNTAEEFFRAKGMITGYHASGYRSGSRRFRGRRMLVP